MKLKLSILILILIYILNLYSERNSARYPFVVYTEDTSFMIGGFNLVTWRDSTFTDSQSPDILITNGIYSFKNQFLIFTQYSYRFRHSSFGIVPFVKYEKWPANFYQLGNHSKFESEEKILLEGIDFRFHLTNYFYDKLSLKSGLLIENYSLRDFNQSSFFVEEQILGVDGGLATGISLNLEYDTRSNSQYPLNGNYLSLENQFYFKVFNSDYSFSNHSLIYKRFDDLGKNFILANQVKGSAIFNEAPFYKLNKLGEVLRAYNENRFIDDYLVSFKSELRNFPFTDGFKQRFGWVAFIETGQVSDSYSAIKFDNLKFSMGLGIRFALIPQEKMNLRIDIAHGEDGINVRFIAQEDF